MSNSPTTTNTEAVWAGQTIEAIFKIAVPVAEAAIIASAPFMATPVLKQIWEELFEVIVDEFAKAIGTEGKYLVIDAQRYYAVKDIVTATAALKSAQASGDPDAITKANADVDDAADAILHYRGDAHA